MIFPAKSIDSNSQIILNLASATSQVKLAEDAFAAGQVNEAYILTSRLKPLLSEMTDMHSQLYEALKDDSAAILTASKEKDITVEFAKLRDRVNYLAGMISIKQGNYREASKHLVQVVQSQRTTGLGEKAYTALREIGFSPKLTLSEQP
ncbi:MAG: hypothetical protein SFT81_04830 [Candidatus Caenarcaniphilales bacterium]|nr:hypothetical protein [Candidatus Caenarcaniphilales bacterium]